MRFRGQSWTKRRRDRRLLTLLLAGLLLVVGGLPALAADSAVIFMYHRFGDGRFPSTNVTIEQFEAHLKEIAEGGYTVMSLPDIVGAFRRKEALPDRTIAITIDDAYTTVYNEAWPRLRRAGLPFTLFAATGPIDQRLADYMTWEQVREMAAAGVTIANHTVSHAHLADLPEEQVRGELEHANRRFQEELGFVSRLHAYPFGEFGSRERAIAEELGFEAAFGQHSGVAHANEDLFALPRFALNERYGSIQRFRLAANALPLRVFDVTPADTVLRENNPPPFGFTVEPTLTGLGRLNCFASNQEGPATIERLGERRFEVRLLRAFPRGRGRINCTMPGPENRWRWFGTQFYVPRK